MWDENPSLIEEPLPESAEDVLTPVVLIHDGGGTTFNYHLVCPSYGRRVFGIANPNFHTGRSWLPGGIPEMARHYVRLLRGALGGGGRRKSIILGGWSLGGMVALEMAKVLQDDRGLNVVGLLMIDSVCPLAWTQAAAKDDNDNDNDRGAVKVVAPQHVFSETTKQETRDKVMRSFAESSAMVMKWEMPTWAERDPPPPPAILLKAADSVPVAGGGVTRVDVERGDPTLGWNRYRENLFLRVVDIPGHHFNVFSEQNIVQLSDAIRESCETFDAISLP